MPATASQPLPLTSLNHCPCGNLRNYADCCGRFHAGESTRPAALDLLEIEVLQWLGLEIRSQQASPEHARIEFIVRYRVGGPGWPVERQHEVSRFVREGGKWFYVSAEAPPTPRSRNY